MGKKLPTMDNLIELIGLEPVLIQAGIENINRNFETVYSELHEKDPASPVLKAIEDTVYAYFDSLRLPECPTLTEIIDIKRKNNLWNQQSVHWQTPNKVHLGMPGCQRVAPLWCGKYMTLSLKPSA